MSRLLVEENSLPLFKAQANLNGTFNHKLFSLYTIEKVPYQLTVERDDSATTFIVEMKGQRHSMTLRRIPKRIDLRLADFVEGIANGQIDTGDCPAPRLTAGGAAFADPVNNDHLVQLRGLIVEGGFISLDLGLERPVQVAMHRTRSQQGITAILGIDDRHPQTQCFTAYGLDDYVFDLTLQSLEHLVRSAAPAERDV